ncbi:Glyoxalase family protein [Rhodopirellula islandica]|uniref:Glyoxalase family protein n=1 Tax=Rhodopirellula islandica TaxID=595434 RepID=A0A0J1B5R3_RHOIS|nr:VOC family protein [Rhodopirellula islandica]KLU01928.1 Glyoxalase family protein [Rhodopirellula islandica]
MSSPHELINYVEIPAKDLAATKAFFEACFNWKFTDYGPEYTAFDKAAGLDGGFYQSEKSSTTVNGAALVVFHSNDLEATQAKVQACGGQVVQEIFAFPGGRRFHFTEPSGNEFAVWSDKEPV